MKIEDFDWNHGNSEKVKKHGISSHDIEDFFANCDPLIYADQSNSLIESRFIAFDKYKNRNIYVVFTFRAIDGQLKIRVISARYAHKKETRKFYEKKSSS
ncbi:MAG: BrnT family toxin [Bacteriovorax sp.]